MSEPTTCNSGTAGGVVPAAVQQQHDVEKGFDPFKDSICSAMDEPPVHRHGNWLTASGHIITAVIGAGVLSLPYSVATLGWIGGIAALLIFAWVTLYTSQLLAEVHIVKGRRIRTYAAAVDAILGRRGSIVLAWLQYSNLVLTALAYNITAGTSLQSLARSICASMGSEACFDKYWVWCTLFGAAQLILSQMPNLDSAAWASAIGAVMSFGYSLIAFGRSAAEGNTHGSIGGIPMAPSDKVWSCCNSIGAILFAFAFSMILIEIQDTIIDTVPGGPVKAMRRAVNYSVSIMTMFYVGVGVVGFMAFGNNVTDNILMSFGTPRWLVDAATIMVVVHMLPAFQIWSQPFFALTENWLKHREGTPKVLQGLAFRLCFRSSYVLVLTFIAICMPFFSVIVGFVGSSGFWPTTVYFPIKMWVALHQPSPRKKFWLEVLNYSCLAVSLVALAGSVEQIATASYCLFCG